MTLEQQLAKALDRLSNEQRFVKANGGDLAGYVAKYGTATDPENMFGDGGEAIYAADMAAVDRYQQKVQSLIKRVAPTLDH